ncbi:peptidoglycan-binding protein [Virgibacillus sp. CBA3643]|uniref:peptidoglycan-binding protein n=1 Tax=Virgibacillus sp. CBA3643 TaxID=2942278 RepID=UPI0035A38651
MGTHHVSAEQEEEAEETQINEEETDINEQNVEDSDTDSEVNNEDQEKNLDNNEDANQEYQAEDSEREINENDVNQKQAPSAKEKNDNEEIETNSDRNSISEEEPGESQLQTTSNESPSYEDGDSGQHIAELKEKLVELGFANWSPPTEHYGPITAGVVKDFQTYYDLSVTGIADSETRAKIEEVLNPPYQDGDRGATVVELKEKLVELGFATWSSPSQFYGSITAGKVEDFQRYYGITPDGVADEDTLGQIEKALEQGVRYSDGDSGQYIVELKEKLVELGFANWSSPTKHYGSITTGVVEDFQAYYDLPVTGAADPITRTKIDEILNPPYEDGDRGAPIVKLKEKLVELSFASWSSPSQFYGSITAGKVEDFQRHYGLTVDGIAGEETLNQIEEALEQGVRYSDGDSGQHIVELKENLVDLGFANWSLPTKYYGTITAGVVEDFQAYYDLPVTGAADSVTRAKIDGVLNPPYQDGDRGAPVIELKEKLVELRFADWSSPSQFYGNITAGKVEDFQAYYDINITGIADNQTLKKIDEILNPPYRDGDRGMPVIELKKKLVELGFANWSSPSQFYGHITAGKVEDFQRHYGLSTNGVADEETLNQIEKALEQGVRYVDGDSGQHVVELKEKLVDLGFANWSSPSMFYGSITAGVVEDFQSYYKLKVTGSADSVTRTKIDEILKPPYVDGDRGIPIVELKEKLVKLGFGRWSSATQFYGSNTADKVKDFQAYYNMDVTGIADNKTLEKVDEILNPPYQDGDRGDPVVELKEKLVELGFAGWSSPTQFYGSNTADKVRDFQAYYDMDVTGITDDETLAKADEILNPPYKDGDRGLPVVKLKEKLVDLGFAGWPSPTQFYGSITAEKVKDFQEEYELPVTGVADEETLAKINEEHLKTTEYIKYDLTLKDALDIQMNASPQTDDHYGYVSKVYINNSRVDVDTSLNVRSGPNTVYNVVGTIYDGEEVTIIDEVGGWYAIEFTGNQQWVTPTPDDVLFYLNPKNFVNDEKQRFQFLDLSRTSNAHVDILNDYLDNKGILEDEGQAFIDASEEYGVSDIYLISHVLLETGNGLSKLAQGIEYNGKTVYNMYGIGAYDNCALECGAQRAYEQEWFTPYDAIVGGAQFIGNNYIKAGQNTLYKMRWNPEAMNNLGYASHQYATDIGWAFKQINTIYNMYNELGLNSLHLEIPDYKN